MPRGSKDNDYAMAIKITMNESNRVVVLPNNKESNNFTRYLMGISLSSFTEEQSQVRRTHLKYGEGVG